MITLKNTLTIFKKYGYSSKSTSPFLYLKNRDIGVCYTFIDKKYGITERIATFKSESDLEIFLKKYQWYKVNGKQYGVAMVLNNYEVSNPDVLYVRNNHVMTDDEIFHIDIYDKKEEKKKKLSHTKRLLVEADSLMERYYLEKEKIAVYTNNLIAKEKELRRYYLELQNLVDQYNKVRHNFKTEDDFKQIKFDIELESLINGMLAEYHVKCPKEDSIYALIYKIWNLNKGLELNKEYLRALRVNDDIDEEMRLVVTKIDFMKELLAKDSRKIIDLNAKFNNIDNQSTYSSIYDDNFYDKYKSFVNKKYDVITVINEFRLTEYLNDFKSNKEYNIEKNVERCKSDIKEKRESFDFDIEAVNKSLEKQFISNLNENERAALVLYVSIYHELFDMIMSIDSYYELEISKLLGILHIMDGFKSIYEENYEHVKRLIELKQNKDIKKSVFKNIDFTDEESFIDSIRKNIKIISNINDKIILKDNMRLYFATNDFDNLVKDRFLVTSSIISPYMVQKSSNYRIISANVRGGIPVLFAPHKLSIPVDDSYSQKIELVSDNSPEIIFDIKDIDIIKDNNVIVYSRFKSNLVNEDEYSYVDDFNVKYKVNISKVLIEKRNLDE